MPGPPACPRCSRRWHVKTPLRSLGSKCMWHCILHCRGYRYTLCRFRPWSLELRRLGLPSELRPPCTSHPSCTCPEASRGHSGSIFTMDSTLPSVQWVFLLATVAKKSTHLNFLERLDGRTSKWAVSLVRAPRQKVWWIQTPVCSGKITRRWC